jgi:diadenosine tetraphosphate (Ap4A) HIT family hydrolase
MKDFQLDPRLAHDGILLGELELCLLLMMNNALVPWFILVPRVTETELYRLSQSRQASLLHEINLISEFVQTAFASDKLNVASIGNIVSQLHVHIMGRKRDDFCWPQVVWGRPERQAYTETEIAQVSQRLQLHLKGQFNPNGF